MTRSKTTPISWIQGARVENIPEWIAGNPKAFRLLYEFASRSRREKGYLEYRGEIIHLNAREFIAGRFTTSESVGISPSEYRNLYKKFEKSGLIKTIRSTNRSTIGLYCADAIFYTNPNIATPSEELSSQPSDSQQFTNRSTTNKEYKNVNNEKNILLEPKYKQFSSIDSIEEQDLQEISDKYKAPRSLVDFTYERLKNYCGSKGKTYKDYKMALQNWVLEEMKKQVERRQGDPTKRAIDARGVK